MYYITGKHVTILQNKYRLKIIFLTAWQPDVCVSMEHVRVQRVVNRFMSVCVCVCLLRKSQNQCGMHASEWLAPGKVIFYIKGCLEEIPTYQIIPTTSKACHAYLEKKATHTNPWTQLSDILSTSQGGLLSDACYLIFSCYS